MSDEEAVGHVSWVFDEAVVDDDPVTILRHNGALDLVSACILELPS